jgi:hypothetical protein
MDYQAIAAVTEALRDRIQAAVSGQIAVFIGPLDADTTDQNSVNLFLYRLAVNADLRNKPHQRVVSRSQQIDDPLEGALPFDLYFLITMRALRGQQDDTSLMALGQIIQSLNDTPELVGGPVQGEIVRLSIDSVTSEEMGRIWTLFPAMNYRTSVIYTASPVWIDPAMPGTLAGPVTSEPHRIGPLAA